MLPAMKITEPYSPSARAKASAEPVRRAGTRDGRTTRNSVCIRLAPSVARPPRYRAPPGHRLHGADDKGQADEDQGDDHAYRREGDLDAERIEIGRSSRWGRRWRPGRCRPPPLAGRRADRRGRRGWLGRENVAHQHPGHQKPKTRLIRAATMRRAEAEAKGRHRARVAGDRPELGPGQRRRAQKHAPSGIRTIRLEISQAEPERQPEAGDDARLSEPEAAGGPRPWSVARLVDLVEDAAVGEVRGLRLVPAAEPCRW